MSRLNLSTEELFLRLGSTPRARTVRAEQLFRKLRDDETTEIAEGLTKPPQRVRLNRTDKPGGAEK